MSKDKYTSLHVFKARKVAAEKEAHGAKPENHWLWLLSKRELVEIVLHLAAATHPDGYDAAINSDGAQQRAHEEMNNLIGAGLI